MHTRHRNGPGKGYRSNAMGMGGVAAASRISPEGSMRGHRVYNSEYRNNNRGGYGRGGHTKQFQPPPQPTRKTDIFVEAGKLAAEYLVSRGVLPPGALSWKWQNDGLKNQVGDFQGFRRSDDLRGSVRERRTTGSFKNYQSEVNKELGRSGSWAERSRASIESDNDASTGLNGELPINKDGADGVQTSSPGEISQEGDMAQSVLENFNSMEDAGVKASSSNNENCLTSDADGETIKGSDYVSNSCEEAGKEGKEHDDFEQKQEENKVVKGKEDNLVSEDNVDLLKHCKLENVPTKARSSSRHKQDPANKDENKSDKEVSAINVMDVNENSNADVSSHQNHEESTEPDVSQAPALEKGVDVTSSTVPGQCSTSGSFPESSVYKEQESDHVLSGFASSNSIFMERDGKRAMDNDEIDDGEGFKKLRGWIPQMDSQSDACQPLSTTMENHSPIQEQGTSRGSHPTLSPDQKNLSISVFPRGVTESSEYMQEKQLFPVSLNTFDLNLNENHLADEGLIFPSQAGTDVTPSVIDLSMRNNCNQSNRNGKHGISRNDIEVIDLDDSAPEDKTFSNLERREDAVFTDLDGFPNNVHNANEQPEVQDGYGLMISELLGNDNPNSAPTGLNSLHNDIGLPNGEGILADDDPIYMSLGEIPISFLRGWEQPQQDYGKPF